MKNITVQDIIQSDIFEKDIKSSSEMVDLLDFVRLHGVPLTDYQVQAMFLLHEMDLMDIGSYMNNIRPYVTPKKTYYDVISKITLADRIKGTAKLKDIMKAQVPSTQQLPSTQELTPKALKESELK